MSLPSVKLTRFNDTLVPPAKALETDTIPSSAGVHEGCGGTVTLVTISTTHRALVCKNCNLRQPLANSTVTYQQLINDPWGLPV